MVTCLAQELVKLLAQRIIDDAKLVGRTANVCTIKRRVAEDHICALASQHGIERFTAGGVGAEEGVIAKPPEVAHYGHRLDIGGRDHIGVL